MRSNLTTHRLKALLLSAILVTGLAGSASAAPLLNLPTAFPDIHSGFFSNISYDTGTGDFDASGFALTYSADSSTTINILGSQSYELHGTVANDGSSVAGTLQIVGDIGSGDQVLLSGNLAAVGFDAALLSSSTVIEFLLDVTGGLPGFGLQAGTNLAGIVFAPGGGDLVVDVNSTTSDTFAVPEPGSLALLASGLAMALARRRRQTA